MLSSPTPNEIAKIHELRETIGDKATMHLNDGCVLRWLRASQGNMEKAAAGLKKLLTFRKAFGLDELHSWKMPEVLDKYYGYGYPCSDRDGSPVLFSLFGSNDFEGIMKSCHSLDYLKTSLAHLEEGIAKADEIAQKNDKPYGQLVLIIDGENMSTSHYTFRPFTNSYLSLIYIFEEYYPLVMKKVLVIRASAVVQYAYSLLRPLLAESMQKLVEIPDNWKSRLFQLVDPEQWPAFWGGNMRDKTGDKCLSKIRYTEEVVPEYNYFDATTDKTDYIDETVYAGNKFVIELDIQQANTMIFWKFKTNSEDIGFAIYYDPTGTADDLLSMEAVFPYFRLECSQVPVEGFISCDRKGRYIIEFDNDYSWFSAKELSYMLRVIEA